MLRKKSAVLSLLSCLSLAACGGGTTIVSEPHTIVTAQPGQSASPNPQATATASAIASATPLATATPGPQGTPVTSPVPTSSPTPIQPPPGPTSTSSIYLGDIAQGAVLIYSSNGTGSVSPSATIAGSNTGFTDSTGASPIYGIAVDENGTVYVLTQTVDSTASMVTAESILVFPAGTTGNIAPARTISLPTSIDAESLAYGSSNLYVTDDSGSGAIDVFASSASGTATASRIFSDSAAFANLPLKVSIDPAGHAYVATYDDTATAASEATQGVYEFSSGANGAVSPTSSIAGSNTGFGNGVLDAAVVDSTGRIDAVLDDTATDTTADIDEFAPGAAGNATPATSFTDATSQGPVDAAIDGSSNLYVSEVANSTSYAQIDVFASGATTPNKTIRAYEAVLPLIAIGPYVAATASGSMPLAARHHRFFNLRHRQLHRGRTLDPDLR